jgi:predicted extracellular nuclease
MNMPNNRARRLTAATVSTVSAGALLATAFVATAAPAGAVSGDIVISEAYGGGGNQGATYKNDFIELYNAGGASVDVSGWSVQYASATGETWQVTKLLGSIDPGEVYLIQEAAGSGGTEPLPPPDVVGTIAMGATAGKVALVTNQTALTCKSACHGDPAVRDYVGYGNANDSETAPTLAPSNSESVTRDDQGTDTDNNRADFVVGLPNPDELPDAPADPVDVTIPQIQGAGHLSTYDTVLVRTTGVVTAASTNGYWLQSPDGDGDPATSDGLFVFSGSGGAKAPVASVVEVVGTVDEFRPGSADGPGLTITEISGSTFAVLEEEVALPEPVRLGPDGREAPKDVIDDDSATRIDVEQSGTYDPSGDAIDFYEELEGMLVELDGAEAVGPTNDFGEIVVLPAGTDGYLRTDAGGVVYSSYETPNPRRITLDDVLISGAMPNVNTGDLLTGPIVGPVDYGFNNFRVYPTTVPTVVPGTTEPERTKRAPKRQLAVATFNVENLDPGDPQSKFDQLAAVIVDNLRAPDVLALEEVQDNSGPTNDGVVAADQTLKQLTDAISAAGGPAYDWREIDPVDGADGGEPGGNIRVAFLFRVTPKLTFVDRGSGDATTPTEPTTIDGKAAITLSPGRIDPNNPAWDATRKPLVGEFRWRKRTVFVIANHFSSKGGDEPLFGRYQPPNRSSETKRVQQAAAVHGFVSELLDIDPKANIVVLGDLNDYQFSPTLDVLTGGGEDLADLINYLPADEQYTYVFEGNSQVLDHILVSPQLAPRHAAKAQPVRPRKDYDVVHVNADFAGQVSDHDPQIVRLRL